MPSEIKFKIAERAKMSGVPAPPALKDLKLQEIFLFPLF